MNDPPSLEGLISYVRALSGVMLPGDRPVRVIIEHESGEQLRLPLPRTRTGGKDWALSPDGRTLTWFDRPPYHITEHQVGPIRLLLEAFEDGSRDVSVDEIQKATPTSAGKPPVRDIFRRSALLEDGVLHSDRRGFWRLRRPDEILE